MELDFLALLCRAFRLSYDDFHFLKHRQPHEIYEFVGLHCKWPRAQVDEEVEHHRRLHREWRHIQVLHPGHPAYPVEFVHVPEPPVYLTYVGDLEILKRPQVAVVGSRTPHFRFLEWLEAEFGDFVSRQDLAVVSGGAVGIDQKASMVAMMNSRSTVQFLPSGLEAIYPRNIQNWKNHRQVLLISEYMPNQPMRRHHFVIRNRLVAALGRFLFVVQAAQKSGSMITARYAMEFGKEVATLPDFPGIAESSGNLAMIREGAQIIQAAADLSTLFERLSAGVAAPGPEGDCQEQKVGEPEGEARSENQLG